MASDASTAGYTKGLIELADSVFGYLQPDGGWGLSNAGLIVGGDGESLLVDTLFDLNLTQQMLDAMAPHTAAAPIRTIVNTHANGDHTYGNELIVGAEIIASEATAAEAENVPPAMLQAMIDSDFGDEIVNRYLRESFGRFVFDDITLTPPTSVFSGRRTVAVGDIDVDLVEVGPAHTAGDVLAFVPARSTVFTGDILFIDGTPLMWDGPVANWVAACDLIIDADVDTIVPGHGPITDNAGVQQVKDYLLFVEREARLRFDAGMASIDAARDIELGHYTDWLDAERIVINVDMLYREFDEAHTAMNVMEQFSAMAHLALG